MFKQLHFKTMLLLGLMLAGVSSAWAADVEYKTLTFSSTTNSKGVSGYNNVNFTATIDGFTWDIVNFNNNNNVWNLVKCGGKNGAYTGTITTSSVIDKAVTKVVVTIDAVTATSVKSHKLEVATDSKFTENLQTVSPAEISTGDVTYTVETPTENCYYRLTYDCEKASANGVVTISKVRYYVAPEAGTVSAPEFSIPAGYVDEGTVVTLTADEGCVITYTTNGNDPTTDPAAVTTTTNTASVTINGTTTIRAIAANEDAKFSDEVSATYQLAVIDLRGTTAPITFTDFSKIGTYTSPIEGAFPASNGNEYGGWVKKDCMVNDVAEMQMKGTTGALTSPTVKTDYGYQITINYGSGKGLKLTIGDDQITGANGGGTGTINQTVSLSTILRSAKFSFAPGGSNAAYVTSIMITPLPQPAVSVGTAEWATYVAENNVTFPSGVTAYIVNATSSTSATLEEVLAVPYGTPVLLNASNGDYALEVVDAEDCDDVSGNLLQVSDGTAKDNIYVLANGANGAGFYVWAGDALIEGRVYLDAPAGARSFISFDAETSTVNSIVENKADNKFYNLNGQRVAAPQKGLYIVNGKKVIIK